VCCASLRAVQCSALGQSVRLGVGQFRRSKRYVGLRSVTSRTTALFQSSSPPVRDSKTISHVPGRLSILGAVVVLTAITIILLGCAISDIDPPSPRESVISTAPLSHITNSATIAARHIPDRSIRKLDRPDYLTCISAPLTTALLVHSFSVTGVSVTFSEPAKSSNTTASSFRPSGS